MLGSQIEYFWCTRKKLTSFMQWINGYWIYTLAPEYVRPPVKNPSLQLLANLGANHLLHIKFNISKFIFLVEEPSFELQSFHGARVVVASTKGQLNVIINDALTECCRFPNNISIILPVLFSIKAFIKK